MADAAVAYQVHGDGPDLVYIPGFHSHVDLRWNIPSAKRHLELLGSFARVVSFDRRGAGASERLLPGQLPGWEGWLEDLGRVLDATCSDSAWLLAGSDGGPLASMFAAAFPDRVSGLLLGNCTARLTRNESFPAGISEELAERYISGVEGGWGSIEFASLIGRPDPSELEAVAVLQRASSTPAVAAAQMRAFVEADIRDVAGRIRVPTYVFHRIDHPTVPLRLGRDLAERVPGARLIELPGDRNLLDNDDLHDVMDMLAEIVTGRPLPARLDRKLLALLFTDIVSSTDQAVAIGDRRWRERLDRHDELSAGLVSLHGGRLVKSTGDGVMATFDRSTAAIECALELIDSLLAIGLTIRAGVHVGEVDLRGSDVGGVAVATTKRIEGAAVPGAAFASQVAVDLANKTSFNSRPAGRFHLKGLPGSWQLHELSRPGPNRAGSNHYSTTP